MTDTASSPPSEKKSDPPPPEENGDAAPIYRAAFLDELPEHPALEPLIHAFEHGNYARLRELEAGLREQKELPPEVINAGADLVRRTTPDPLARYFLLIALVLLILVIFYVYGSSPR